MREKQNLLFCVVIFWCIILQNYISLLSSNDEDKGQNQMKRILLCKNQRRVIGKHDSDQEPMVLFAKIEEEVKKSMAGIDLP